jgi:hypothetical protein
MDRRTFLSTSLGLAAASVLPADMTGVSAATLHALHARAQALAAQQDHVPATSTWAEAGSHLRDVAVVQSMAPRHWQRSCHRTACLTALVMADTARWMDHPSSDDALVVAERHASAAADGPLLAQVLLLRASAEGADARAVDAASAPATDLVIAALHAAGTGAPPWLRAWARYTLAWQFAASNDPRAALMELDAADFELGRADRAADVIGGDEARTWGLSRRGAVLRRLGRHAEAASTLSGALVGPPLRQTAVLTDLARLHRDAGDVDAAAAALEDAYLVARRTALSYRVPTIHAIRATLPTTTSVTQLDEVMREGR